jgi:DNA-binding SARP family transcriptional activator
MLTEALSEAADRSDHAMIGESLHLAVLGPLQVVRAGAAVELPRSKKARALLAYLAITGRTHTRRQLCDLFWDVADDPRSGLRWCLSRLRTTLHDEHREVLVTDRNSASLSLERVSVDMRTIEQRLVRVGELQVTELEDMAQQFRGPFLEGLDLADLHGVQAWLIAQRSAARQLRTRVLTELLDRSSADPAAAVPHARRLVQTEPHVEQWHAKHVQLLFAAGRKQEAEEQYHAGLRELDSHRAGTHGLRMAWRRLRAATGDAKSAQGALGEPAGSPFVGRQTELGQLESLVERALDGDGGTLTIAGEPGIGKSRLVRELAQRTGRRGVLVLEGKCTNTAYPVPYLPFIEALEGPARDLPDDALTSQIPLLARILPGLAQQRGIEVAGAGSDDVDRYAVFRAVAALLDELASDDGLVLVLEDLHWADTQSLLMVAYLARLLSQGGGDGGSRVLLIATYRDVEVSRAHPLRDTLTALQRESHYHRIALKALDDEAARQLIVELGEVPADAVDAIYAQTEGHPLFIEEVVKHLAEEERFAERDDGVNRQSPSEWVLPEGVRDVIGRRLSRMSELCNRMLANASAFTSEFHWSLMVTISGGDEDDLLDALDEALAAELLRECAGARGGSYEFSHALIRQALYEELSASRRTRLHKKIGEAIESVYSGAIDAHLVDLAHHYFEAAPMGAVDKFVDYSIRAGQQAMKLMAFEEAAQLYERALATLFELDAEVADGVRGQLHELYAKALATMSRWVDASVQFERALAVVAEHDDRRRARLLLHAAICSFWMLDIEQVRVHAGNALELAETCSDVELVAAATGLLAQAASSDGEQKGAVNRYASARALAGESDDLLIAQALQQYPISLYWEAKFDSSASTGANLLKVARSHSDGSMVMNLLSVLGLSRGCAGHYRESAALFREAEQFGRDHGIDRLLARAACMQTGCLIDLGAIERAQQQAELALEKCSLVQFAPSVVSSQLDLLMLAIAQGQIHQAEAMLPLAASALTDTKGFHTWIWAMRVELARAQIALFRDDHVQASVHAKAVMGQAEHTGRVKYVVAGQRVLAASHLRQKRPDDAARLLRSAAAAAESVGYPALLVQVAGELLAFTEDQQLAISAARCVDSIIGELDDQPLRRDFEQSDAVQRIRAAGRA